MGQTIHSPGVNIQSNYIGSFGRVPKENLSIGTRTQDLRGEKPRLACLNFSSDAILLQFFDCEPKENQSTQVSFIGMRAHL